MFSQAPTRSKSRRSKADRWNPALAGLPACLIDRRAISHVRKSRSLAPPWRGYPCGVVRCRTLQQAIDALFIRHKLAVIPQRSAVLRNGVLDVCNRSFARFTLADAARQPRAFSNPQVLKSQAKLLLATGIYSSSSEASSLAAASSSSGVNPSNAAPGGNCCVQDSRISRYLHASDNKDIA